jgi:hypothetical protein
MTASESGAPRRLSTLGVLTPIVMRRRAAMAFSVLVTIALWCLLGWLIARGALENCPGRVCPTCPEWPLCLRSALVLLLLALAGPVSVYFSSLQIRITGKTFTAARLVWGTTQARAEDVTVELVRRRRQRSGVVTFKAAGRSYRVAGNFTGFDQLLKLIVE